jgi:apolipoprotein N-acyltransferase
LKFLFIKNRPALSPSQKKERNKTRLLLILSGSLMGISFPPFPFPFTVLIFAGLIPYLYVVERREKLIDINLATYLFALIFSLITLYWVGSWQESADPFLMISGVLLVFVNPVFFLIPSTLYYFAGKIFNRKISLLLLPFFWVTYEHLYMITDASFPWLTLGNGLPHFISFIQVADIIGTLGLSLVVLFINIFLYRAINLRSSGKFFAINIGAALLFILVILIYGFIKVSDYHLSQKKIKVALIQPNLDPWEKWKGGNLNDIIDTYIDLSDKAIKEDSKLVIWPETALPVYLLSGLFTDFLDTIHNYVDRNNIFLLTGMPDIRYYNNDKIKPDDAKFSESGNYYYTTYNAIYLFTPGSREVKRYGKMKLVPFGERVPFVDELPFLGKLIKWGVGLSGWNVGKDTLNFPVTDSKKDSLLINGLVCYESIYPSFVSEFVENGAELIAVVTNDSWYGNSSGPYQHKEMSVLRAIENRRTVVRAANGGISCIINPLGKTVIQSKMFKKTYISGEVILQNDLTFYTRNPLIIPVLSTVISIWITGIFLLKKIKEKYLK